MTANQVNHSEKKSSQAKQCVIILGMHRSGTSSLTGALSLLGFDLGRELVPADPTNPKGHFENMPIHRFNKQVLGGFGVKWSDVYKLSFDELAGDYRISHYSGRLKSLIRQEFVSGRPVLIKDPRICVLLPLWKQALDELGMEQTYVILTRNPADTIKSLGSRNNLSTSRSEVIWTYYVLASEYFTRGTNRIFINHEAFLSEPVKVVKRIVSFFDFPVTVVKETESKISSFIDPKLIQAPDNRSQVDVSRMARDVYSLVSQFSNGEHHELSEKLDLLSSELVSSKYFTLNNEDESLAEIMILYTGGEMQSKKFKVRRGEHNMSVPSDPGKEVSFARLIPCNNDCVIRLSMTGIFLGDEYRDYRERVFSNASVHLDDTFLFTSLPQFIGFKVGRAGVKSIHFTVEYEVIGDRASKQFVLTRFRQGSTLFHGNQPESVSMRKSEPNNSKMGNPRKAAKRLIDLFSKPFQFVQRIFKG